MAAARPIVASRSGAIPELLDHGRCGLLSAPGDVQHLAESLDQLLSDRGLCQRLSLAAHARAREQYDTGGVAGVHRNVSGSQAEIREEVGEFENRRLQLQIGVIAGGSFPLLRYSGGGQGRGFARPAQV